MTLPTTARRASAAAALAAVAVGVIASPASAAGATSQATSQSVNVNLLSGTAAVALSDPSTSSTYDGTQSADVVNQSQPVIGVLNGVNGLDFLTAGVGSEYTSADTDGGSFACTEIAGSSSTIQVGTATTPCTFTAGNTNSGVTLDLNAIPGVGSALSSIADVKIHLSALDSFAGEAPNATPTGSASVTGGQVIVNLLGGLVPITLPLNIPTGPNSDLLPQVISALAGNGLLANLSQALSTGLAGVLKLETNYQTTANGTFSVSALHVELLNGSGAVANLATSTVGPNAITPAGSLFPTAGLPITAGGVAVAAALITPWYRRRRRLARAAG